VLDAPGLVWGLVNNGLHVAADVAMMLIDNSIVAQKTTPVFGETRSLPVPLARYGMRITVAMLALY
jgi:hypothetical protein